MKRLALAGPTWPAGATVRIDTLGVAFLLSVFFHISAVLVGGVIVRETTSRPSEFLFVHLIEAPQRETAPAQKVEASSETKKPSPDLEKPKAPSMMTKSAAAKSEPVTSMSPAPVKEELPKSAEAKPPDSAKLDPPPSVASGSNVEGGGSAAGAGNLFGKGDVGVVPGPGNSGGGGTAVSGLGRGSGAPGLPAQTVLRTNREAKPIQTVRANYPPMALRAGLEGDVTLKIEVDAQGNVTKAEITKSGGAGFDEEALKAVKQSRFEPAQKEGQLVAAEFTYIYRFRIQR